MINLERENYRIEEEFFSYGYNLICGVDEAGRGPLAGPVVAAAVIMPRDLIIEEVDDSKRLTPQKREKLFDLISKLSLSIGIGIIGEEIIDEINIKNATYLAMEKAIFNLNIKPDFILVDGYRIPQADIPQKAILKGDSLSHTIACASIIAKVTRDRIMDKYHEEYSVYGFHKNKGYGTREHLQAIEDYGICKIHRKSFAPISKILSLK